MNQIKQVLVPDIGDFQDVEIIEVHVKPGDTIETESPLITIESDKATMDVPAPFAGKVENVLITIGEKISEGSPLVDLIIFEDFSCPKYKEDIEKTKMELVLRLL